MAKLTRALFGLLTPLFVVAATGCAAEPESSDDAESVGSSESELLIGNQFVNVFSGPLQFGASDTDAITGANFLVGHTFRAKAARPFTVAASGTAAAAVGGINLDTKLFLYGPKQANGSYPLLASNDNVLGGVNSSITKTPASDGIYLVVTTAKSAGKAKTSLTCGSPLGCDFNCIVPLIYSPQCGADGVTYGNAASAACNDVPIVSQGKCPAKIGEACSNSQFFPQKCAEGFCKSPTGQCGGEGVCTVKPAICTFIYSPVCGCDGKTYGNSCVAAGQGASVKHTGTCP